MTVVDSTRSTVPFNIRGSALTNHASFAYKVTEWLYSCVLPLSHLCGSTTENCRKPKMCREDREGTVIDRSQTVNILRHSARQPQLTKILVESRFEPHQSERGISDGVLVTSVAYLRGSTGRCPLPFGVMHFFTV